MFTKRLASSVVMALLFIGLYFLADTVVINLFVALIAAMSIYELFKATAKPESKLFAVPSMVYAAVIPFVSMAGGRYLLAVSMAYLFGFFLLLLSQYGKISLENVSMLAFLTLFITLSLNTIVYIAKDPSHQVMLPLVLGASVTDVFAYLVGVTMGRHKLIVRISPKKTVEGSIGGILGCGLFLTGYAAVINHFTGYSVNIPLLLILGVLIAVISQIGDLSMSVIKRTYSVKDFGNCIPGHGGILDRVDSWLFVAPLIYIFMRLSTLVS